MDKCGNNIMPKSPINQLKIGAGILSDVLHKCIIVIGDNTPTWNDGVVTNNHTSITLSAEKTYVKGKVNCGYLAMCFSPWDARLAKWLAGQEKSKKPLCYSTLSAYFKLASKKYGKCTILLYECEQTLARHGAQALLGFIEQTKEYAWYVLIGDSSLNGLEIPERMRPRRIDIADFNLTSREMEIYFSASHILLTKQQYAALHQLIGGWTFAAYMLSKHLKHGEVIQEIDLDIAITKVFGDLDKLVLEGMNLQERYIAILLSAFDTFPYELALACCPYNERIVREALKKIPGLRFSKNGTSLAMHPLIRAYWQSKTQEIPKKLRDGGKSRAARWYAANKGYMAALVCALDAGDYALARNVLTKMNTNEYYQRVGDIAEVLERIDVKNLKAYPMLWAYKVALFFITMDFAKGNREKAALEEYLATQPETPDIRQAKGEMLLLTAFTSIVDPCCVAYFRQAAEYLQGNSEICDAYLNDTIRNGTAVPYDGSEKYTLLEACRIIEQAAPFRYQCTGNWGRGHEHLCYAEYGYLTGNAQQLVDNANRALTDAIAYKQLYIARAANLLMLLHYTKTGMVHEAIDSLRSINTLAQMEKDSSKVILDAANARVCFCTGQLYLLPKWVRDAEAFEARVKCYQPGREYYMRGCYLLYKGQLQRALRLVCEAMGSIRFTDEWITQLHLTALKMLLYMALEDFENAEDLLNEYYKLAAGEQLIMPLLEFGKKTAELMEHFLHVKKTQPGRQLPPAAWLETVRQGAIERQRGNDVFFTNYYKWLQERPGTNLTGNEYIILQLLCLGYTNEGIEKEVGISKNYIRAVTRRVCKKLGVESVEKAVAFGRSFNIHN